MVIKPRVQTVAKIAKSVRRSYGGIIKIIMNDFKEGLNSKPGYSEEEIENILSDLTMVGPEKTVGYIGFSTLINDCKIDPKKIEEELKQKGLKTMILNKEGRAGDADELFLFAYDELALGLLLKTNQKILMAENWPTDPEPFIRNLKVNVPIKTALFDLIADAFGDKTHPHRKNFPLNLSKSKLA